MSDQAATNYPPSPWDLRGQLHASVFLLPPAAFPPGEADLVPPGWSLVTVGGNAVVAAAWVVYEPGGVLAYRELMATILIRRGLRIATHIVRIWVDDGASLRGGRELWAIPKELADFVVDSAGRHGTRFVAHERGDAIAVTHVRRGLPLPGRWPVGFSVVQQRGGSTVVSPVRVRAGLALTRARWIAEPFGSLGFVAARRPRITISLRDFVMTFGSPTTARRSEPAAVGRPR